MSKRTREAERYFGESLRVHEAFTPKATPDYKAQARERKAERRCWCFGCVIFALMVGGASLYVLGVIP